MLMPVMLSTHVPVDPGLPKSVLDWASTIGSVATALGVLIALGVSLVGGLRRLHTDQRVQTSLIYAHIVHTLTQSNSLRPGVMRDNVTIRVVNASPVPIYDVIVSGGTATGTGPAFFNGNANNFVIGIVPAGEYSVVDRGKNFTKPLPPFVSSPKSGHTRAVTLTFRDAAGRWWQHDAHGRVKRILNGFRKRKITADHAWQDITPAIHD